MKSEDPELLELTKHAEEVLSEREIPVAWVRQTLQEPEATEADASDPDLRHALRAIAAYGDRVLRVVYDPASKPWRVITAFFDRRARRP